MNIVKNLYRFIGGNSENRRYKKKNKNYKTSMSA